MRPFFLYTQPVEDLPETAAGVGERVIQGRCRVRPSGVDLRRSEPSGQREHSMAPCGDSLARAVDQFPAAGCAIIRRRDPFRPGCLLARAAETIREPLATLAKAGSLGLNDKCRVHGFELQTVLVDAALDEFRSRRRVGSVSLIVLLTDGGIDTGSKARDAEIQHLMETQVLAEVRKQKTRIYPIAFTTDADVSLFQKIARGSGGECYLALAPDALESVFGRLATAIGKLIKPLPGGPQPAVETTEPPENLKPSVTSFPETAHAFSRRGPFLFLSGGRIIRLSWLEPAP